ncbi:MAG: ATP-binding cassette domain-containing protein, partial [Hyphomicrobiaceae bacterium]
AVRLRQAMVFQRPVLLRRSVAANIDFVLALRGGPSPARRDALLDHVGLAARARQPARLLSGGEQQRLTLARALATEPDVLFLDEPTANLDPASVLMIEDIVTAAHANGTKIIFVTHDIAQARRLGGDIVFLDAGRVVEHRVADEFFGSPETETARAYLDGRLIAGKGQSPMGESA